MKTVLVVEGEGHDIAALQALLQDHGYMVSPANDKSLKVSEVTQDSVHPTRNISENPPLATFRSCLDDKLYAITPAVIDAIEVNEPPQGVEQHFRGIYENGPLGIFRSSLGGKLLSINPVGARMLKYGSPEEMIEAVNRTGIAEALYLDGNHRQEVLAQVFSSDNWIVCDEKFRCKDGSLIDCAFHMRAVRDAAGKPLELEGFLEDVSERKQVERMAHFTQFAIDKTVDQAYWIDDKGRFVYVNDAACYALGYSKTELAGMSIFDIDPDCTRDFFTQEWQQLKRQCSKTLERRHRASDGRIYPVEIRANYLVFEGQEYVCFFATDISRRKRQEEALLFTQYAIDKSIDQAFWVNKDSRLIYVNDAACQTLGYSREELTGMSVFDIDPDFSADGIADHWKALKERKTMRFESRHRAKDGRIYPVEVRVNYFKYDGVEYSCSFATDISERKKAERQLRQANLVLENSPAVLFRWKAQSGWPVEMVSGNVAQFGYSQEELLIGRVPFSSLVYPEDLQRVSAELEEYTSRGEDRFQQEYRIITKEGDVLWVDDRTVVERDAEGKVAYYQGVLMDVTDRKRTERVMTARMRLLQFADTRSLDELLKATLDEAEELTGSQVGFFVVLDTDQRTLSLQSWSTQAKRKYCAAEETGSRFDISEADIWDDCIRQRQAVFRNDYSSRPHRTGLMPGYAPLIRELLVPVLRGDQIVAIVALGNKSQAYTPQDVVMVSLLADLAWTIAERKQAEEALRESEGKYRSIVENAPFGISHSTKDGKLVSVNPALASILKYDSAQELRETVNRSSIQDVLFPKPSERLPLVENILSCDSWTVFNNRLRCKDGSIVTCRVHSRRIVDENGQAGEFESFQENITAQLAAEEALRESEEKFRVLAETSPVSICTYRGDHINYANPAMERLTGYSAEELCRMKFWEWAHEDYQEQVRNHAQDRLAGKSAPGQYEFKSVTKGGEELYVLVSAGTMERQAGAIGVASFLDITERKRAEQLIRTSLEEKEVLLREIHHRVKNNLQVVSSLLYLQSQKLADPELQNHFLESQSRICSMALAHEQLYQSKCLSEISVKSYMKSLAEQLRQVFQRPEQQIECRTVIGDIELDIAQVIPCGLLITELLSNAYKHAFADGRRGIITISMNKVGGQLILSVADNGVGLPAGLDYRHTTTLGLQLVTALTNQLNATLEVKTEGGSLFRVTFNESSACDA